MVCFPKTFLLDLQIVYRSPNPGGITTSGLGSSYFARHYFRNRFFFLFLWVLRCFSSPRYLLLCYFTHIMVIRLFPLIEFPHSDTHGYSGYLLLPVAFRSLSRPSSALGAQAFSLRSLQLNLLAVHSLRITSLAFSQKMLNVVTYTSAFLLRLPRTTKPLLRNYFIVNKYYRLTFASIFFLVQLLFQLIIFL